MLCGTAKPVLLQPKDQPAERLKQSVVNARIEVKKNSTFCIAKSLKNWNSDTSYVRFSGCDLKSCLIRCTLDNLVAVIRKLASKASGLRYKLLKLASEANRFGVEYPCLLREPYHTLFDLTKM